MATQDKPESGQPNPRKVPKDWLVWVVTVSVFAMWALWFRYSNQVANDKVVTIAGTIELPHPMERFGQFGDSFGALNVLFTALAFVAVWWTGRMQREELILQRDELHQQRLELRSTRAVIARQSFESMFFQTLQLTRELHGSISIGSFNPEKGNRAVSDLAASSRELLAKLSKEVTDGPDDQARAAYGSVYLEQVHTPHRVTLGPYFRTLYFVIKLIDSQVDMDEVEKHQFSKLARAQLSTNDVFLLAANACCEAGGDFKSYIEKYCLLKHMSSGPSRKFYERCFAIGAFEEQPS